MSQSFLNIETCQKARMSRDASFDGRFFTAVRTTRIYCRPVCPVRPPLEKNVSYYSTASAAEQDGYRPCLRCRPETAPFSPAWNGTQTTVDRALKLIEDGALDTGTVDNLAERLGIGGRQLSRLFQKHLGISPTQLAKTRRIQKAKRLLDSTDLPITEIAFQSGFQSLRRFNSAFVDVYRMPPTELKRRKSTQ
ncbi:MAG: bifunctional transcriptional activator/DNA repair enzyme AdaA [Alphaproteobacteria bacterium]